MRVVKVRTTRTPMIPMRPCNFISLSSFALRDVENRRSAKRETVTRGDEENSDMFRSVWFASLANNKNKFSRWARSCVTRVKYPRCLRFYLRRRRQFEDGFENK